MTKRTKIATTNIAPINEAYGELREALHFTGYAFERGCQRLRKLLADDSWKHCGGGFTDVDTFLATLQLDQFAKVTEERRELARLIKALRPEVSERAIATAIGSKKTTVHEALVGKRPAKPEKTNKSNDGVVALRPALSGVEVARLAARRDGAVDRRDERLARIEEIARGNSELPTGIRYPIILADCPWRYEHPPMGDSNRSIENHYPTMALEEICALPVADLAADDAVLFLYATAPKLYECMKVLDAWGFLYRTCGCWDKELIGMGHWFRNQHELLLIGMRGDVPPPPPGEQPSSVYRERRTEHSRKPEYYYKLIEAWYPTLPKIELFRRGAPRPGWAAWGNEVAPLELSEAAE